MLRAPECDIKRLWTGKRNVRLQVEMEQQRCTCEDSFWEICRNVLKDAARQLQSDPGTFKNSSQLLTSALLHPDIYENTSEPKVWVGASL